MSDLHDDSASYYQPTMHQSPQPPQRNRTPVVIAFTIAGIALVIAVAAVLLAVLKPSARAEKSSTSDATPTSSVAHLQPTPATVTETKIKTTTAAAPPAPAPDIRSQLSSIGYAYPCENSSVVRSNTATTCAWAQKVQNEVQRRGEFSGIYIYSDYTGSSVATTCRDSGGYYVCQGKNYPFIVIK